MTTAKEVADDWEYSDAEREKIAAQIGEVLFHEYATGNYEGYGFTLFRDKEGRLMESNGSHCSCYGLEGQWSPEPTFKEALQKREHKYGDIDEKRLAVIVAALPDTLPAN